MFRRTETAGPATGGAAGADDGPNCGIASQERAPSPPDPPGPAAPGGLPRTGGLDSLLSTGPVFATRVHGYDRLQVDNYVAWAESELAAARREADHLLARYGSAAAELEISRRLLAEAPKGRDVSPVTDRVRDILRLAADEASSMVESAESEAQQLLAEARLEADERLRKAHQVKELAAAAADEMHAVAEQERAEAAALLERTRAEAGEMVAVARAERDQLGAEAAEAREELIAVRAEVGDLSRQLHDARSVLRRLTEQIETALALASAGPSEKFVLVGNTVAEQPVTTAKGVSVPS